MNINLVAKKCKNNILYEKLLNASDEIYDKQWQESNSPLIVIDTVHGNLKLNRIHLNVTLMNLTVNKERSVYGAQVWQNRTFYTRQ